MRLLHTSDWHLGQTLHQFDRSYEHEQFLNWLLDTLVAEQVDGLLIAGDVFDNSNPSAATLNQLYRFITEARRRVPHLNIVITAGNHDSPGRLEAPAPFLALFGAAVVGHISRTADGVDHERLVVPLKNSAGNIKGWCIAMPFLRPSDVPRIEGAQDPYTAGIEALYQQAFAHACTKREEGQAIIAIGHCHLTGGQVSEDSERRIIIGGVEALSAKIFDPAIAYVALGHLHLAQTIGSDTSRRYCGSPLPMSFSEINYKHQILIVDFNGEAVGEIRGVRIPRSVELMRVPAEPSSIEVVLAELEALTLADCPESEWPYLQVRVQLTQPEPALRSQIDAALADKPVRLARIETSYASQGSLEAAPLISVDELNNLAPEAFFQRLYQHRFAEDAPAELMSAFTELLNASSEAPIEL